MILRLYQQYHASVWSKSEIDRYLETGRQDFETMREAARHADPMFYQQLADAKKHTPLVR